MIVPSASELRPCPVCGKPAELHSTAYDNFNPAEYVVFCQDSHCAGNQAPACSTAEEAAATWNKLAGQPYRWHKTCCPACGWCEADEKGFQEHLATLPKPSRWERLSRRINWDLFLTDGYWICCIVVLFQAFDSFLKLNGIPSGFTLLSPYLRTILLFAAPLCFIRIVYSIISRRMLMREFDAVLSSSESTTTPPPTKENHHG